MTNRLIGNYGVETDFYVAYVAQAKEILNGNLIIDQYRGPVYQIFLAITAFLFIEDYYTAGKLLNVICASLSLYFISKIVGSIFNREGALLVVLFVAVNQVFWRYTYEPGTDMLFLLFYTSSLFLILNIKSLNRKKLFIAGILTGLAYLTRYTGISLIIISMLIITLDFFKSRKDESVNKMKIALKHILFYVIPVLVMISTWGVISKNQTGYFFYNMNFQNTAYTVYKPDAMSKDEWVSKYQNSFNSNV
ncbi:MAG: glycosyltransferase family 39 protein [Ignavibacteria bacterium]